MRTIEARAVISAADKTGAALAQVTAKFKDLKKAAQDAKSVKPSLNWGQAFQKDLDKLKLTRRELAIVRAEWDRFMSVMRSSPGMMRPGNLFPAMRSWKTEALTSLRAVRNEMDRAARSQRNLFRGGMRFAATALGVGTAAYMFNRGARAGTRATAEYAREGARDYLAGLTDQQSKMLEGRALELSGQYTSVDATTLHGRLREAAMSMRSLEKALDVSDTIARGLVVMQSLKGKDQAITEANKFFKALDVFGKNIDPAEVTSMFHGYIKALGVEGVDLNMADVFQLAKRSRAAGATLSNRFLMMTAPALMQDLGASETGAAMATMFSTVLGGTKMTQGQMAAQKQFGVRDANGRFLHLREFMEDPDLYAWNRLMPALQAKGVNTDDNVAVAAAIAKLFPQQRITDIFTKLITQREQYQARTTAYEPAPGLDAAAKLRSKDPFVALEGLMSQLRNFVATLADPLVPSASAALNGISDAIARFTKILKNDPETAKAMGYDVARVGALGTAGAAYLFGKGMLRWAGVGGGGAAGGVAEGAAGVAGAAAKLPLAARFLPWLAGAISIATTPDLLPKAPGGRDWWDVLREDKDFTFGGSRRFQKLAPAYQSGFQRVPAGPHPYGGLEVLRDLKPGQITAQLEGQARIELVGGVTIDREFLRGEIRTLIRDQTGHLSIRTDGPGSTGKSMPEAAPGPTSP